MLKSLDKNAIVLGENLAVMADKVLSVSVQENPDRTPDHTEDDLFLVSFTMANDVLIRKDLVTRKDLNQILSQLGLCWDKSNL